MMECIVIGIVVMAEILEYQMDILQYMEFLSAGLLFVKQLWKNIEELKEQEKYEK